MGTMAVVEHGCQQVVPQSPKAERLPQPDHRHIWIVAGTSCCGKSTVAQKLTEQLGCMRFIEGDDYHTAENKAKMHQGHPLTDEDRAPWLAELRQLAIDALTDATPGSAASKNVVMACSALKRSYRQVLRAASLRDSRLQIHFVFLTAPVGVLIARAKARQNHFFSGEDMIRSQFETLEMPTAAELAEDVIHVDCTASADVVEATVFNEVEKVLTHDSAKGEEAKL